MRRKTDACHSLRRPNTRCWSDPNALRRCIGNLIGDARRHGSHVSLTGVVVADGIDILADDDGLGITIIRPADRDHAFSAFVRLDSQPIDPEGSACA